MPQDGLRSNVYRSFITCDDPSGVVECGAIRKQKRTTGSNGHGGTDGKEEIKGKEKVEMPKRVKEESSPGYDDASSLQLLRISRGIQKVNQIIESWSKGLSYEGQSKDIARDLMRGALDLEESLTALGRLQEGSDYMAKFKQKQKIIHKIEEGRNNEVRIERSMSERYLERNREKASEKPRISSDGSSRDCYEELRSVIRESFIRQNLLNDTTEEKTRLCRSNPVSSSEIVSASSSQSSSAHGNDSSSTKSSLSVETPPKNNRKSPSLIAKLMGLEYFSSKPSKSITHEHAENEAISRRRKPSSVVRKEDNEHMRKKDVVETVQFKGHSRSYSAKGIDSQSSTPPHPEERSMDNVQHIVLIKPVRASYQETEAVQTQEEKAKRKNLMIKKPRVQGEVHPRLIDQRKEVRSSDRISKKMKGAISPTKRENNLKEMVAKPEEKDIKIKEMASSTKKASGVATRQRLKEERPEKVEKAPQPAVLSKKIMERDMRIGKEVPRSPDPVKVTPKKSMSSDSKSDVAKNHVTSERRSGVNSRSNQKRNRIKKEKTAEKPGQKEDEKVNNRSFKVESQLSSKEETDSSEFRIEDHCDNGESSCSDATFPTVKDKEEPGTSKDRKVDVKAFLLSNPDFLTYAKGLLDLDTKKDTSSAPYCINSATISNQRLYLDCAKEFAELKSLPDSRMLHRVNFRICISLDQLLVEVHNAFRALRSYSNFFSGESCLTDSIQAVLERDLNRSSNNKLATGIWHLGWRNGFSVDDAEQVVMDVERLILSGLIEEMLS